MVEELLQVQDYLNTYENRLHKFMGSLDNLANAWLSSTLVDPVSLERYLKAMEQDVADTAPDWELALPDITMQSQSSRILIHLNCLWFRFRSF